ncbi:TIGR00645 family protein [Enterovirga aerilata]|uniref:TIGR00645 family protein n=1 Tax=Enterovirga aerilata TaxID=2730920 RepID=UPI003D29A244
MAERVVETVIFSSRWLLAPFYVGLVVALVVLLLKFLQELVHFVAHPFRATEADIILGVLTLVDLTFTGSLVVIVVFSGYENFVSKIDMAQTRDWPEWMSKIDFTGLKLKLMSSIVAISAIQLLKIFMDLKNISDREVAWYVGLHVVFVISGLVFALTDRLGEGGHGKAQPGAPPQPHL